MEQTFLGLGNRRVGTEDLQAEKASGSFQQPKQKGAEAVCLLIGQGSAGDWCWGEGLKGKASLKNK